MADTQKLQEAAKCSADGAAALAKENYNEATKCFKQASTCYGKATGATTDEKSREALLLLSQSFERSNEWVQQRKLLEPYKQRIAGVKAEKSRAHDIGKIPKIPSKVSLA
eukprot:TRINITY_DN2738_c0_g2_i6.p2 TRINITY_DN2738_c0_g2~~TRINITY_DN2738_c0_g2_i6.p2  ORF type:complete len:110 (+),score=40.42 TRINITY_DN2738_c0_g2_i6:149-478(+)